MIGGGPAGLMAAEKLARAGVRVTVYDRMPSLARKFLMAGRGGLNLTHSEPMPGFAAKYGAATPWMTPVLDLFPPEALRDWAEGLGQAVFVGSSGRVFPVAMKASPLLRAWLRRLDRMGVAFALRHDWRGWDGDGHLLFVDTAGQEVRVTPDVTVLALGGASWPRLGADGGWANLLRAAGAGVSPLRPANCGFVVPWRQGFASRFAGQPLKPLALSFGGRTVRGEAMITQTGIEGGAVYALSAALRDAIDAKGHATVTLDLRPGLDESALAKRLQSPRGSQSFSTFMRKAAGLPPAAIGLLRETLGDAPPPADPHRLAARIKAAPLTLTATAGIARAISSAGGVARDACDDHFMLRGKPGVFVVGEMLDWEAPTGGYLLQGCFSTAVAAARGALAYLAG